MVHFRLETPGVKPGAKYFLRGYRYNRVMVQNPYDKRWRKLIYAAGLIGLILYLGGLSDHFKPTPDSCEYMGLAQSLAQGDGYQFNGRSGSRYPPLLPIMLAGVIKVSAWSGSAVSEVFLAKFTQIILAVLFVLGSRRLALRYLNQGWAMLAALLVWANLTVFQHCMFILSDILYGCLSIWALVLLGEREGRGRWIAGAVLISLGWLTRSVGLLLAAAVMPYLLFLRTPGIGGKKRWVWALLAPALCALPFVLWNHFWADQEGGFYLNKWMAATGKTTMPGIIFTSFLNMAPSAPLNSVQTLLNIETMTLPFYFAAPGFVVILIGWGHLFRKHRALSEWYVLFYAAVMSVWLFDQGSRFYLPLLPLLLIYGITGLTRLGELMIQQNILGRILRIALPVVLLVLAGPLAQYFIQYQQPPSAFTLLRNGYIYSVLAVLIIFLGLLVRLGPLRRLPLAKTAGLVFLLTYLGIGWLYGAGFAYLEHGLSKARGPMLAGYESYWQMGIWLKQQDRVAEPVLCGQSAIVHLAGERIIREPENRMEQTRSRLESGDYINVLWLSHPEEEQRPVDINNEQIGRLIGKYPHQFRLQALQINAWGKAPPYRLQPQNPQYKLYRYVPGKN